MSRKTHKSANSRVFGEMSQDQMDRIIYSLRKDRKKAEKADAEERFTSAGLQVKLQLPAALLKELKK